jgi:2'-5' RNA ligase
MKRTFIAVKVVPEEKMLKILEHLKESLSGAKIKWIEPDILHITLFFLGDTDEKLIPVISEKLKQLSFEFTSFELEFEGIGIFKNIRDPRVVWVGTRENNVFRKLKSSIDSELIQLGFEGEKREFKPHLTIGRIKWIRNRSILEEMVKFYKDCKIQRAEIKEMIYYESILRPEGPEYLPLLVTPFKKKV